MAKTTIDGDKFEQTLSVCDTVIDRCAALLAGDAAKLTPADLNSIMQATAEAWHLVDDLMALDIAEARG